ncbi:MAG: UDP-3-O-[3-hydroxymyristoyl] N-acetylglucosamine deacetylase [Pirellulaceae bacterium]|nr:UDP-3-O-[3-hydroxymyristoyl] N-acetylglucosamine deacetylase [Pirellulaceae bacterium]
MHRNPPVRNQTTLRGPCSVTGRGYWSGQVNTLTFLPAPAGTGIRFFRQDLNDSRGVQAVFEHCQGLSLRTCLSSGWLKFEMIEHVMAALAGLRVDNIQVHCTASEIPGMDGSSLAFTNALSNVGTIQLPAARPTLVVDRTIRLGDQRAWLTIEPAERFTVEYQLDYGSGSAIGQATYMAEITPQVFYEQLAAARTFITQQQADQLQARGLAKHVTNRDLLLFDQSGPVNNQLRFPDECARHKVLDVVGDLAVVGVDLLGKVTAHGSGHQLNGQLAGHLRELYLHHPRTADPTSSMRCAA